MYKDNNTGIFNQKLSVSFYDHLSFLDMQKVQRTGYIYSMVNTINLRAGSTIKSTTDLNETLFENSIILLTEVNENGAMGFVMNKPFNRKLNDLVEFNSCKPFPLFDGGPVDKEHLYFIHRRTDIIYGGNLIANNIFIGGDFKQAVEGINNHTLSQKDVRIFVGYCGWDAGELEAEINEGSWTIDDDLTKGEVWPYLPE